MNKKFLYIFFSVVLVVAVSGILFNIYQSFTSFRTLVLNPIEKDSRKITSIEVIKTKMSEGIKLNENKEIENRVEVTDKATVDKIINDFSKVKLMRTDDVPYKKDRTEYWMTIYADDIATYSIAITDHYILYISGHNMYSSIHKKYSWEYKMSHYDPSVIQNLFK